MSFTLQVIYELFGNRLSHSVKWTILFKSTQKKYKISKSLKCNDSNSNIWPFFFFFLHPSTIIVLNSPIFGCQIHIRQNEKRIWILTLKESLDVVFFFLQFSRNPVLFFVNTLQRAKKTEGKKKNSTRPYYIRTQVETFYYEVRQRIHFYFVGNAQDEKKI